METKEAITYSDIKIECKIEIITLYNLHIKMKAGQHMECEIIGLVENDKIQETLKTCSIGESILIRTVNHDRTDSVILFDGMIKSAKLECDGRIVYIHIYGISNSFKLDIEKKKHSFQDINKTYKDIIDDILKEYDDVVTEWNVEDKKLEHPLIQYDETDWEFINRVCSYLNTKIIIDYRYNKLCIYIGAEIKKDSVEIEGENIRIELKKDEYIKYLKSETRDKRQYVHYVFQSYAQYSVGDTVKFMGDEMIICSKSSELKKGYLLFIYRLGYPEYFEILNFYNTRLKGLVLEGIVMDIVNEKVQVFLDIDHGNDLGNLYFYNWIPITGNAFYCMPERGEKVSLYIPTRNEKDAFVNYCLRSNTANCDKLHHHDEKSMESMHKKKICMYPQKMSLEVFSEVGKSAECNMDDSSGFFINTIKDIKIISDKKLCLQGKSVNLYAQKEATLVRKDILSPTVMNICNAFDFVGESGGFKSIEKDEVAKKGIKSVTMTVDRYELKKVAAHLLSNIPIQDDEDELMALSIGSMPVLCKKE